MVENRDRFAPLERDRSVLWSDPQCIVKVVPERFRKHYVRNGDIVGHPFVRLFVPDMVGRTGTRVFLHGEKTAGVLRRVVHERKPILCTFEISRTVLSPATHRTTIDLRWLPDALEPTHEVRVLSIAACDAQGSSLQSIVDIADADLRFVFTDLRAHALQSVA